MQQKALSGRFKGLSGGVSHSVSGAVLSLALSLPCLTFYFSDNRREVLSLPCLPPAPFPPQDSPPVLAPGDEAERDGRDGRDGRGCTIAMAIEHAFSTGGPRSANGHILASPVDLRRAIGVDHSNTPSRMMDCPCPSRCNPCSGPRDLQTVVPAFAALSKP